MKMANSCSAMDCQAVRGVWEAYQCCGASLVIMEQRGNKSQLLSSKRRMAAIDDTVSGGRLRDMRCGDARAHAPQDSAHGHGRAAGLASLLARMFRALLRQRRGSKAGRYYRRRHNTPKVLNFEELWCSTTWSASKSSYVAEVRGQLARSAVARTARDHCVGAVRQPDCDKLFAIVSK